MQSWRLSQWFCNYYHYLKYLISTITHFATSILSYLDSHSFYFHLNKISSFLQLSSTDANNLCAFMVHLSYALLLYLPALHYFYQNLAFFQCNCVRTTYIIIHYPKNYGDFEYLTKSPFIIVIDWISPGESFSPQNPSGAGFSP